MGKVTNKPAATAADLNTDDVFYLVDVDGAVPDKKLTLGVLTDYMELSLPVEGSAGFMKSGAAEDPVNPSALWISETGWNPVEEPVYGRSTPETAQIAVGGHFDETGGASRNYLWGGTFWLTNPNTAPLTAISGVAQGWKVRAGDMTARQCGDDGDGHALEVLSGQWAARATVARTNGSPALAVSEVTFRGSRFCIGNAVSGTGIPGGATILSVTKDGITYTGESVETADVAAGGTGYAVDDVLTGTTGGTHTVAPTFRVLSVSGGAVATVLVVEPGNYTVAPGGAIATSGGGGTGCTLTPSLITAGMGYPDTITLSANASSSGSGDIEVLGPDNQNIGILISGSGDGGAAGDGNANGRGIQLQSYGDAAFLYGINIPGSAVRSDGTAVRLSSMTSSRGFSVESCTLDSAYRISNGTYTRGIEILAGTFSSAAIAAAVGGIASGRNSVDTTGASAVKGASLNESGLICATVDANYSLSLNRTTSDGDVARFRRDGVQVGSISVTGSATAYNTSSDARLKTDVVRTLEPGDVIPGLAALLSSYSWIADGRPGYGVIAQEAATVLPEMVTPGDDVTMWAVDWSKVVPYLVAYIARLEERLARVESA